MTTTDLPLRRRVRAADAEAVGELVATCGVFSVEEVGVAVELVEAAVTRGEASGTRFLFAEDEEGVLLAYACYRRAPCTDSTFELDWLAVRGELRGLGLGRRLLAAAEARIAELGGRRVFVAVPSRPPLAATRAFYEGAGYAVVARLKSYYRSGDDKVILSKTLPPAA